MSSFRGTADQQIAGFTQNLKTCNDGIVQCYVVSEKFSDVFLSQANNINTCMSCMSELVTKCVESFPNSKVDKMIEKYPNLANEYYGDDVNLRGLHSLDELYDALKVSKKYDLHCIKILD